MPYEYFSDEDHLKEWLKAEQDPARFKKFLTRNIYSCKDFSQYLELNGGQRGMVDYAFLGGAQIDVCGNVNSIIIENDYCHPRVRLPGSGGANDFASFCWRTIIMMLQDRRRFVEKLDFLTTPGYLTGRGAKEKAGLPLGTGPYGVVINLAVMGFDEETKRMRVEIIENTGFELIWPSKIEESELPSKMELEILRQQVDPEGYIISR